MGYGRLIIFLIISLSLLAVNKIHAQTFATYDPNSEYFHSEVKLIEEFIERFNGDSTTALNKIFAKSEKGGSVPRNMMMISIFNLDNKKFTDGDSRVKEFFHDVLDSRNPVRLSFCDSDWYAEARGEFLFNGKMTEVPLVLHIKSIGDDEGQWMITGIGNQTASKEPAPSIKLKKLNREPQKFIATSAYATNFAELIFYLTEKMHAENYFEPQLLESENGRQFINEIRHGQLKFQYVKNITFHFYQVDEWIFTVDQYKRKTFNSGWLISNIERVNNHQKTKMRRKLLNR